MGDTILWIHADCLSPYSPVLDKHPRAPAIYVWDDDLLRSWQISLKCIQFIYECLLELPVVIRRGDVAEEVLTFAHEHNATRIATMNSPSPRFRIVTDSIQTSLEVDIYETEPFLNYEGPLDLKRFSRYWKRARKYAFR